MSNLGVIESVFILKCKNSRCGKKIEFRADHAFSPTEIKAELKKSGWAWIGNSSTGKKRRQIFCPNCVPVKKFIVRGYDEGGRQKSETIKAASANLARSKFAKIYTYIRYIDITAQELEE